MKIFGYIILFLAYPISYSLIYLLNHVKLGSFLFVLLACLGIFVLSFIEGRNEQNKKKKYLLYYPISFYNLSIIIMYLIDLLVDDIFNTSKVFLSLILSTIFVLCSYLFQKR